MSETKTSEYSRNYIKNYTHTIKIDSNVWQHIKKFIIDNYMQYSINVLTEEDSTKNFIDFDRAGQFIIDADRSIKKISIDANDKDENIKIEYVNGIWTKSPAMSAETNHSKINEEKVKDFLTELRDGGKPEHINLFNCILMSIYMFFMVCRLNSWFPVSTVSLIMFIAIGLNLVFNVIYSEMKWGRKRILFWLDDEKKTETLKRIKMIRTAAYVSYGVILIYMIVMIFFIR